MAHFDRRDFLKSGLALAGGLALPWLSSPALAGAGLNQRLLANLFLGGGPDIRHLLPPAFDSNPDSYGYTFWQQRWSSCGGGGDFSASAAQQFFSNTYDLLNQGNVGFGIHKRCGWLKAMWQQGKVAVLCNVLGATSRDHDHAAHVYEHGDRSTTALQTGKPGWGGRLVAGMGGGANLVALTSSPRPFCYSPDGKDPLRHGAEHLLSLKDTRKAALFEATPNRNWAPDKLATSLKDYYAEKAATLSSHPHFGRLLQHERNMRNLGQQLQARLGDVSSGALPRPAGIRNLYEADKASGKAALLSSAGQYFGRQIGNLYDAIACQDILNMRVASLEYGGWDSHEGQRAKIDPQLEDIFGSGKGFDQLYQNLDSSARQKLLLVMGGEFGRQLSSNGGNGTDHGRGLHLIIIGDTVKGGFYGDPFPAGELARIQSRSPDIEGKTAIEYAYARLADWLAPGAGSSLFPGNGSMPREQGLDLANLLA